MPYGVPATAELFSMFTIDSHDFGTVKTKKNQTLYRLAGLVAQYYINLSFYVSD
jgi:hypothetical protein